MTTYTNLNDLFTAMANAIREKKDSTESIIADNFPTEIENLRAGFDYNNQDVTIIPDYAFYGCEDLNSVDCYNLTNIGASAFENCTNLKSVILYKNVASVGENAFKGCGEDLIIYCYFESIPETWSENWNPDGCKIVFPMPIKIWDASKTTEDNVIVKLYNNISNKETYFLVISGSGDMKKYSEVPNVPWYNKYATYITSVEISNDITSIGDHAFFFCIMLTSITIPDSVTSIGESAFQVCKSLTSVNIPDGVTSIGENAFYACYNLTSITIPDSVTSIGENAFKETAYYNNPSNWENSVLYIGNHLLYANSTLSGDYEVRKGTISIANSAFRHCTSLTSITIPDSVTTIGGYVFYGCNFLTSITYTGTIFQWNAVTKAIDWNNNTGNYTVYCTDGTIAKDGTITYY